MTKTIFVALGVFLSGCATPGSSPLPIPQKTLVALSKVDHTLAVVDPVTLKVLSRIPVGPDPHEVVVTPDGTTAYVSNNGSGLLHEINVIDLIHLKALPNIDIAPLLGPHGLAFVGEKLWFTAEGAKSVGRYDPQTGKVDWVLGIGQNRTHMLQVAADEKTIYATNVDSGTVSILENLMLPPPIPPMGFPMPGAQPHMGWIQTSIPAGKGSEGFDVSPDRQELWTSNAHAGTMTIIDLSAKKVKSTVDTKTLGISRLKFTPDGKRVLVSSLRTGDFLVFDAQSHRLLKKLNLGQRAAHILIDADGNRAFVSCTPDNYIAVIDLNRLEITGHIDVGGRPDGLDWAIQR